MTKKSKEEKVIHHHIKEVEIKHSQEKDASTTREVGAIHYKRGYMVNSLEYDPKKNILTTKEIVHCSECGKDNIITLKLDAKSFENIREEVKKEDLDKIFQALVRVSPPKNWKEDRDEKREN